MPIKKLDPEMPKLDIPEKDEYTVNVIRDYNARNDVLRLPKKDPNCEYYFVSSNPRELAKATSNLLLQGGGWQIVPRDHAVNKCGIDPEKISPDGAYRVGDLILAFMPKQLHEEKKAYEQKRADAPMQANAELLAKGDPVAGGNRVHESMKGFQTKESLKM